MYVSLVNQLELEQAHGLKDHLLGLSKEFLNEFNITHLGISKFYFDGRYLGLATDFSWKEKMVYQGFYNDFIITCDENFETNTMKSLYSLWQAEPTSKRRILQEAFAHGFKSGFYMTKMYMNYIEVYTFGSNKCILELYEILPNREELEMFCLYLRENILQNPRFQNLALGNIGNPFSLSQASLSPNKYAVSPIPKIFSFRCNNIEGRLYRQQLICLALLSRGYGYKDIGRIMDLSPRTVESYITNIKGQYDNPSTSDLLTTFNNSPLAAVNPFKLHGSK